MVEAVVELGAAIDLIGRAGGSVDGSDEFELAGGLAGYLACYIGALHLPDFSKGMGVVGVRGVIWEGACRLCAKYCIYGESSCMSYFAVYAQVIAYRAIVPFHDWPADCYPGQYSFH